MNDSRELIGDLTILVAKMHLAMDQLQAKAPVEIADLPFMNPKPGPNTILRQWHEAICAVEQAGLDIDTLSRSLDDETDSIEHDLGKLDRKQQDS